jgi:hypothetical protein
MRNGKKRIPPQGDEQCVKSPGKTLGKSNGGNAGGNIPSDLAELIELWRIQMSTHSGSVESEEPRLSSVSSTTDSDALNRR